MTKNMNIKKAASALNQNQRQIKAALDGKEVIFAAVEKGLGRAQFLLRLEDNKTATGTPRGLFTSGTMRVSPGHIVIVEGNIKNGFEIMARIDDLATAKKLVKLGYMPPKILAFATSTVTGFSSETEEDIFDRSEVDISSAGEPSMGGSSGRRQQESMAAALALAERLGAPVTKEDVDIDLI